MIIGLDVGGTHTDTVLLGNEGIIRENKVLTQPENLFESVLSGLERITEGIDTKRIKRAVLSTTLTTNAIVQDKVPNVGMIVCAGPGIDPECFRTNEDYAAAAGYIDHRGREVEPIDEKEIRRIGSQFRQKGIQHIGVVSKFSIRNPAHELKIGDLLKDSFEKIFLGHRVSGNLNFPRRIATTYLNASVYPLHRQFFIAVKQSLEKKGLSLPIHILKADGGTMNFDASIDFPGQTILSGPAASVMGATAVAPENEEILVLDIGGTTTDMAILVNRVPILNPLGITLGHYKTLIRSLETLSIGIGGDSAVRIIDGKLTVGPDRVGPAMAFGGSIPTPTDALAALDIMKISNKEASLRGIRPIADQLGVSVETAAGKIFDHACQIILSEARGLINRINSKPVYTIQELQEGFQVKPTKILILGSPAPYFTQRIEELSGLKASAVPRWEVANAIGAAMARTTCEVTLFADTQQEIAFAGEEGFSQKITKNFSKTDAVQYATKLLKQKAIRLGADIEDLETEVVEELQFNMVRGFYTTGRNIRVKVQVKPGLIRGWNTHA